MWGHITIPKDTRLVSILSVPFVKKARLLKLETVLLCWGKFSPLKQNGSQTDTIDREIQ